MNDEHFFPPASPTLTAAGWHAAASEPQAPAPPSSSATASGATASGATASASRRGAGRAQIIGAALLAAVLSSGSTVALIEAVAPPARSSAATATTATSASTVSAVNSNPRDASAIAAATLPSVVTITTEATVTNPFSGNAGTQPTGTGSGFVLTSDGAILTNYHVVQGSDALSVRLSDGRVVSATVVKTDQQHDLAIIKADATGLTPAKLGDSNAVKVGEVVLAFGSPLGDLTGTVTEGIISAKDRTITAGSAGRQRGETLTGLLQTDAAINPGNSGGPIVDLDGKVIGVAVAGSTNADGLNFAIPIEAAKSLIASAGLTI
jgi:S1-C subfamily serine protease